MSSTVKEIKEKTGYLKRSDLYTIGVGQAIGSGVLTLIGPAILLTGQSAWLAYVAACIWGFMMIAPIPWITSTLKLGGGFYSLVGDMAGKRVAGMYAVGFLPQTINLCGVDVMAKVQKILVILLFVALGLFIVLGCLQLKNPVFEFTAPDFFSNGPSGFFSAIMLYVYSTNGYSCIMNYGKQAKEAHKDIPKALLYCIPTLMVVYGGVAIVASGVLPLDQVAGQPLTLVAKNILNPALFTVFMIGGPVLALSSSINSTISNNCIPVAQSCKDGWLPKSWAAQNRRGAYWKLMTFTYLMGILPVLLDFSISDVVNNIMLLASALAFLQIYAYFQLPKKHAEAWEKSPMHISNGKYYFLCCLSLFAYICIFINSCRSLKLPVVIISLIAIVVCMAYGWFRSVSPDVKMETSVWED